MSAAVQLITLSSPIALRLPCGTTRLVNVVEAALSEDGASAGEVKLEVVRYYDSQTGYMQYVYSVQAGGRMGPKTTVAVRTRASNIRSKQAVA